MIEFNGFLEHRKLHVQSCYVGTLVPCSSLHEGPVCFLKNAEGFIIELTGLTMPKVCCLPFPERVRESGLERGCRGKEKAFNKLRSLKKAAVSSSV